MGNHKHFKVKGFWNFFHEAEIHAVPNTWEKWFSIAQEKYGKTNISNLWVSQIFWMKHKQKSIQFPKHGKSEFS